jgi:hypothetical protein
MEFFLQRDNNESKPIERTPFPNLAAVQRDLSEAETQAALRRRITPRACDRPPPTEEPVRASLG